MVKSMNAAVAGLRSHQTRMDVLGNNIANVNTWGFKSRTTNFQDSLYSNLMKGQGGAAGTPGRGTLGGINTSQLGYGAVVSSVSSNFSVGSGQYTGNALDCMVDGPGFLMVGPYIGGGKIAIEDANGKPMENAVRESGLFLSRVGILSPDSAGYLVDDSGNYVYGFSPIIDPDTGEPEVDDDTGLVKFNTKELTPLRIPNKPGTNPAEQYSIQSWTIGSDGTVVGIDDESKVVTVGKIAVASVQNPSGLDQKTGYLYKIGNNAGSVLAMETKEATGLFKSNYLEMSNVDLAFDISTMITTQRGYQANTKIITVTDEMLEQLVNMKR